MPRTKSGRTLVATAGVLLAAVGSVFALRGVHKPYVPAAPEWRTSGAPDAPVLIAEFSDFQCPGCAGAVEPLKQIKAMHGAHLRIVFKHLAWDFHANAKPAAIAADCAGKQGKFWEMHDLLFARQPTWGPMENAGPAFESYAEELKLDAAAFSACRADPAMAELVAADFKEAQSRWVGSTPTFFINGKRFVGSRQLRTLGLLQVEKGIKAAEKK